MALEHFNNQKLRNKLLIIYFVGFLFPILAINTIFSYNMYKEHTEFELQYFEKTIEKSQLIIQNKINSTLQIIYTVYISRDLSTFLSNEYKSMSNYMNNRNKAFSVLNQLRLRNDNYRIYTINKTIESDPIIEQITDDVMNSQWFTESQSIERGANLFYSSDTPEVISIIRPLDYDIYRDRRWDNIIKADILVSQIKGQMRRMDLEYGVSLISNNGEVVLSNDKVKSNYKTVTVPFTDFSLLAGWKLEGRIPKTNFLSLNFKDNKLRLFLPQTLIAILGSIVILLLSRSFYKRIYKLSNVMKSVEDGDFKLLDIKEKQFDEITMLSMSYNIMVNRIDSLINEISEAKLRERNIELVKNKAQLSALRSQINPHYLFNVLESIRMKSIIKKEKETADIIKHLSKSYRHIISWEQNLITVNEELGIANDFLIVQKYRFEEKLTYNFVVSPECENLLIPKLTLQPFIENSCIHGIEKSSQNGNIIVKIYKEAENLVCIIEDNGVGIPEDQLNSLKSSLNSFEINNSHIGFTNTYWRLKKHFSGFSLNIESEEGTGTKIILTIPTLDKEQKID